MPENAPTTAADATLERAARRAGVLTRHTDGLGRTSRPAPEVIRALCDAVESSGEPDQTSVAIATPDDRAIRFPEGRLRPGRTGTLLLETGGSLPARVQSAARVSIGGPIPLGVHRLELDDSRAPDRMFVLARPKSLSNLITRAGRQLAVFLPLHAATPGGPQGVGTYTDLRAMCDWAQSAAGALVGTLPLFPAFLDAPCEPSPYAPVSRLFWNELFVDLRAAPEWRAAPVRRVAESRRFEREARLARTGPLVDYPRSWRLARAALMAMAAQARRTPRRWAEITAASTGATADYALFRAAVDATGTSWDRWPAAWRAGRIDRAPIDPRDIDLYQYAQALAREQLAPLGGSAGSRGPLYLDLPVGVHAHGFDTFSRPDLFLHGVSAGAPPDALNTQGQTWGFPPMHPRAGRADGHAHLRAMLRHMLSVAGVLRIDHVMGLYRMYCVPRGCNANEGAYVRYPEEELFAIVMIEAARAGAVVVGEDLGTVPPPVRRIMKRRAVLGMHVQQFALGGPPARAIHPAGRHALASLNTHDTPTFAAFWHASDVSLRRSLTHVDAASASRERAQRTATRREVVAALKQRRLPATNAQAAAMSLMRLQARGRAPISLVNLEDLWAERRPQNVPGTSTEYPNWRRRASRSLRSIIADKKIAASLALLARERRSGGRA